jgi:chromosomal replication initiator protein
MSQLWEEAKITIQNEVSVQNFQTWFKDVSFEKEENHVVTLGFPNDFTRDWFLNKYQKIVIKALRLIQPEIRSIEGIIVKKSTQQTKQPVKQVPTQPADQGLPLGDLYVGKDDNLNSKYTLESFIVGTFNQVAYSAAKAVIDRPGVYNPLYIFGSTGLGKTHLIQAIGNAIKAHDPNLKVYYITSERFANDYVDCLQKNMMTHFKEKYRKYHVIIMDDIQFLANKNKIQEELFHIFNAMYDNNRQIVFSSDKHPNLITGLEDRLQSRMGAGMVVDITEPEFESKLAILRAKRSFLGVPVDDAALEFIAHNATGSIRELEGILQTLMNESFVRGGTLTTADVQNSLRHILRAKRQVSIDDVVKAISHYYNLKEELIYDKTRRKEVVHARQVIMFLLREDYSISFPMIGRKLGDRDHTTVIHSCDKVKEQLITNQHLAHEIETLRSILKTL